MRIAVDAFGGDNAPDEVIKGAAEAIKEYGVEVVLTGDEHKINERIKALDIDRTGITVENANGVIQIEDNPLDIRKAKADCSMGRAFTLVNEGKADAFVSAGSTAAIVVGGTMVAGRLKGIKRPALVPIMPSTDGLYLLLDGGANSECRPEMLLQFAVMGSVYMEKIMGNHYFFMKKDTKCSIYIINYQMFLIISSIEIFNLLDISSILTPVFFSTFAILIFS